MCGRSSDVSEATIADDLWRPTYIQLFRACLDGRMNSNAKSCILSIISSHEMVRTCLPIALAK